MLVSAELRWFWKDSPPPGIESWFRSGPFPPGGGNVRGDAYLIDPAQSELGLKERGGGSGVEVKGLVALGATTREPFAGRIQIWAKWTSLALSINRLPRAVVMKRRWLRKFDTSGLDVRELALGADEQALDPTARVFERGCLVEWVAIDLVDDVWKWWALSFESFGSLDSVQDSLRRTALHITPAAPLLLERGLQLSYPEWLCRRPV